LSFLERIWGGKANAHYRAGMHAFNAGRYGEALERFVRAVECGGVAADPVLTLSRFYAAESAVHLGRAALERDDTVGAAPLLERALEWNPQHPALQYLAGVVAAAHGDLARSAERLEAVLAQEPEHPDAILVLAAVRHARGASADARRLLGALHSGGTLPPYLLRVLERLAPDFPEMVSFLRDFAASGRTSA
jgi:tetratricopeptide (TPR) repeat protein